MLSIGANHVDQTVERHSLLLKADKVWGWLGGALESGSSKVPEVAGLFQGAGGSIPELPGSGAGHLKVGMFRFGVRKVPDSRLVSFAFLVSSLYCSRFFKTSPRTHPRRGPPWCPTTRTACLWTPTLTTPRPDTDGCGRGDPRRPRKPKGIDRHNRIRHGLLRLPFNFGSGSHGKVE